MYITPRLSLSLTIALHAFIYSEKLFYQKSVFAVNFPTRENHPTWHDDANLSWKHFVAKILIHYTFFMVKMLVKHVIKYCS